jgi:hypothetical protein
LTAFSTGALAPHTAAGGCSRNITPLLLLFKLNNSRRREKGRLIETAVFIRQAMNLYIQIRLQGENPLTPAPKKAATQPPLFGSFWGQKEQSLALNKAVVQVEQ